MLTTEPQTRWQSADSIPVIGSALANRRDSLSRRCQLMRRPQAGPSQATSDSAEWYPTPGEDHSKTGLMESSFIHRQ